MNANVVAVVKVTARITSLFLAESESHSPLFAACGPGQRRPAERQRGSKRKGCWYSHRVTARQRFVGAPVGAVSDSEREQPAY
jgi:hypothetical protein